MKPKTVFADLVTTAESENSTQQWNVRKTFRITKQGSKALPPHRAEQGGPPGPASPGSCPASPALLSPLEPRAPHSRPAPSQKALRELCPVPQSRGTHRISVFDPWQRDSTPWASRKGTVEKTILVCQLQKFHSNVQLGLFGWHLISSSDWTQGDSVRALSSLTTAQKSGPSASH